MFFTIHNENWFFFVFINNSVPKIKLKTTESESCFSIIKEFNTVNVVCSNRWVFVYSFIELQQILLQFTYFICWKILLHWCHSNLICRKNDFKESLILNSKYFWERSQEAEMNGSSHLILLIIFRNIINDHWLLIISKKAWLWISDTFE